jgi:pimeloyl-ACP methyl ester carboxylesterase
MGLDGLVRWSDRAAFFLRAIETRDTASVGTPEWLVAQFLKSNGIDPESATFLLRAQVPTRLDELAAVAMTTLVLCGQDDRDNGCGADLAKSLVDARFTEVPGNHMTAPITLEFAETIRDFLIEEISGGTGS